MTLSSAPVPVLGLPEAKPLLRFDLAGHGFALPVGVVREMVHAVAIARLPMAPPVIEGVVNYRGTIVPVLDMRLRFGLPPQPLHPDQHFILAHSGARLVALRVDRVVDLIDVADSDITLTATPGAAHLAGIARLADGLVVIHDLERFLSLDEAAALDTALDNR